MPENLSHSGEPFCACPSSVTHLKNVRLKSRDVFVQIVNSFKMF